MLSAFGGIATLGCTLSFYQCGNNADSTSIGFLLIGFGDDPSRKSRMPVKSNVTAYGRKN
jgi:hypothetical protein